MSKIEKHYIRRAMRQLAEVPHLSYGCYPTPIEELPRLREALGGGPRLLIKRDDYTGLGFGGNKVRKLDYVLSHALANGVEVVITAGGEKSNHARVTASFCTRLGLRCILVLNHKQNEASAVRGRVKIKPASLYLDELLGAEIHYVNSREERAPCMAALARRLRREGKRVAEIPIGASMPLGALGFVRAVQETAAQLEALGVRPNYVFHASSSGGTQAGLVTGCQLFGLEDVRVIGISPDDSAEVISGVVLQIISGVRELLGIPSGRFRDEITVLDSYVGPGYGVDTPESVAALKLLARTEGILLDPIYTAKAMAALIDWVRQGKLSEKDTVLFWHTGGQLGMFYSPT